MDHRRVVHASAGQRQFVAHEDVFGHRQVGHQGQFLVNDDDAGGFGFADRLGLERLAVPENFAVPGAVGIDRRQHLHQGGFAGAVLAAQADAFARPDLDVDAIERFDTAEGFDDAVHLQQIVGHGEGSYESKVGSTVRAPVAGSRLPQETRSIVEWLTDSLTSAAPTVYQTSIENLVDYCPAICALV